MGGGAGARDAWRVLWGAAAEAGAAASETPADEAPPGSVPADETPASAAPAEPGQAGAQPDTGPKPAP